MNRLTALVIAFALLLFAPARALDIQLTSGDWQPINIFVELFLGEENLNGQIPSDIIADDLTVSGNFRAYKENQNHANAMSAERLGDIRNRGGEYLITGTVNNKSGKQYTLSFTLYDTLTNDKIGSYSIVFNNENQRLVAHNVSNWIYETILSKAGIFHTKVAYVVRHEDGTNELKVADYDGHNRLVMLTSQDHIISPTWTANGNSLLYVSFEQNKPVIYQQSLLTGERSIVANFKGSNSAPAASPDNRTIAAALTEHGGLQQIYLLSGNRKARLRESKGIDTEPVFSPDSKHLAFISDESGSPQIYQFNLDDNKTRRLTFGSRYNVSPDYSAQGDVLTLVRRDENGDNISILDIRNGDTIPLTNTASTNSPSFAPNGDVISFIDDRNKKNLATVSVNGKVIVFWRDSEQGEIINPSWSPIKSDWF
ncbi:MAG: hypothetical protein K0U15_00400 [Proteobacteria bacterium]|nr:hypothetical protein [Pseudomonadota bacterium]MCH9758789.1 hypothetical protein [Pseudomonadota bacterium]